MPATNFQMVQDICTLHIHVVVREGHSKSASSGNLGKERSRTENHRSKVLNQGALEPGNQPGRAKSLNLGFRKETLYSIYHCRNSSCSVICLFLSPLPDPLECEAVREGSLCSLFTLSHWIPAPRTGLQPENSGFVYWVTMDE